MKLKYEGCIIDTSNREEICQALGCAYFERIINRKFGCIEFDEVTFWASDILRKLATGIYWAEIDAIIDDIEDDPETHGFEKVNE